MLDASMHFPLGGRLLGRASPGDGGPRLGGLARPGCRVAAACRLGPDCGHALERLRGVPRPKRRRAGFDKAWQQRRRPRAPEGSGVHARGDGSARALREYITKKAGLAGMRCEEAARHLHVLASDVAEHVDSVGGRDEYGFDLVVFAAGGTKLVERDKERRGRIDVSFRMDGPAGSPAAHGGDAP